MLVSINKLVVEPGYQNPNPLAWLLVNANEAMGVVEGVKMMALVDTGSQFSALTEGFCTEIWLRILPLGDLTGGVLHLVGMGGILIPYKEYVEASLTIPD